MFEFRAKVETSWSIYLPEEIPPQQLKHQPIHSITKTVGSPKNLSIFSTLLAVVSRVLLDLAMSANAEEEESLRGMGVNVEEKETESMEVHMRDYPTKETLGT
ncbi:unnamed protein product [Prunus armeniaca]|uniref:Uncharacterized protein n=1 Tax=Prunus armeniaca TaxID=36596 RepID=A0A6J5WA55_PRUAR|nr:unnamed protein product [Prunus armeniaca]